MFPPPYLLETLVQNLKKMIPTSSCLPNQISKSNDRNEFTSRNVPAKESGKYSFHVSNPSYLEATKKKVDGPIQST